MSVRIIFGAGNSCPFAIVFLFALLDIFWADFNFGCVWLNDMLHQKIIMVAKVYCFMDVKYIVPSQ